MTKVKEALADTIKQPEPLCFMGIDPGLKGAIAFYFPDAPNRVSAEYMPVVNGGIDGHTLASRIRQLKPDAVIIELVGAMPKQGVSSTFNFGEGCGVVRGVVSALGIPYFYVPPSRWKKHFRLSSDKEASRQRALELFPDVARLFELKKSEALAEAALIARYHSETRLRNAA